MYRNWKSVNDKFVTTGSKHSNVSCSKCEKFNMSEYVTNIAHDVLCMCCVLNCVDSYLMLQNIHNLNMQVTRKNNKYKKYNKKNKKITKSSNKFVNKSKQSLTKFQNCPPASSNIFGSKHNIQHPATNIFGNNTPYFAFGAPLTSKQNSSNPFNVPSQEKSTFGSLFSQTTKS